MKDKEFCKNHPDRPIKSKGLCRSCYEKQLIESNPEYKRRQRENSHRWHLKHKERDTLYLKSYREKNPQDSSQKYFSTILRVHKITREQYEKMVSDCKNCCMLCNRPPHKGKRLHLDHDHKTGKVRGLLCTRCNWYLHTVEKDPEILERIKTYING